MDNKQGGSEKAGELVRLSQIEYDTEPGEPDMLGWPVADAKGDVFGQVDDMLVDVESGEIPFASIRYNDRCTAIPLDLLYLDEDNKRLVMPVDNTQLADAPEFTDETEDVQVFIDYWDNIAANWEDELIETEEENQ